MFATGTRCLRCGERYPLGDPEYVCPRHGAVGTLDVEYDYDAIRAALDRDALGPDRTMWRYLPLYPVTQPDLRPPLEVGGTPLYAAPRLAETLDLAQLYVKDDGRNPTASFKDRASAIAVTRARELGVGTITTASSGNAAAALAGLAASVGMRTVIFVPESAPAAKIAQLLVYGAEVYLVRGSYDRAFELCLVATESRGWYCRNTGYNPFMTEGKKSVSYEIAERLGWEMPDWVVVSVGDGSIIGGVYKGFYDLLQLGWIDRIPRLLGAQATGSDALARAWEGDGELPRIEAQTRADSISADYPRDGYKALRAVRDSNGAFIRVDDSEILAAIPELARGSGVFAEPAAAAGYAAIRAARRDELIAPGERVTLISTGSGLKDIPAARAAAGEPTVIDPDPDALRRLLQERAP